MKKISIHRSLRIPIIYLIFSVVWILTSDRVLAALIPDQHRLTEWQSYKGIAFVILSAVLIYVLLRNEMRSQLAVWKEKQESEASFQHMFANNPQPMWVYELDTLDFLAVNEAAVLKYGYSDIEFAGMKISEIRPAEDIPRLMTELDSPRPALQHSGPWRHKKKSGEIFEVEITSHTLNFNGLKAVLVTAEDVTERRQTEEALRTSKQRSLELENIINRSPAVVFQWGSEQDSPITYVSDNIRRFGYTPEDFYTGQIHYSQLIHPDDLPEYLDHFENFVGNKSAEYAEEYRILTRDGQVRWVEDRLWKSQDQTDHPIIYQGLVIDITHRKTIEFEHHKIEAALKDSQHLLTDVISFLPDATFVVNRDGQVIIWNHAIETLTGVPAANILGKGNYEYALPFYGARRPVLLDMILHPQENIGQYYQQVDKIGDNLLIESFLPYFNNGTYIWAVAAPLYDANGHLIGAIETVRDTTTRKTEAEALRETTDKLMTVIEAAPLAIVVIDLNGKVRLSNRTAEQIFGWRAGEVIDQKPTYISPDQNSEFDVLINRAIQGETLTGFETSRKRRDGTLIDISLYTAVLHDEQGKVNGIMTIVADITNQKKAERELAAAHRDLEKRVRQRTAELSSANKLLTEEMAERVRVEAALRESENLLRGIIDSSPALIYMNDLDNRILLINQQYEALFGIKNAEVLGKDLPDLWPAAEADQMAQNNARVLEEKKALEFEETVSQNGEPHTYLSIKFPIFDSKGNIRGICGISTDITERTKILRLLEERTHQLELANREMEAFSYSVSHDLRAPLRHIDGFSQALAEDYGDRLDETGLNYIQRLRSGVRQMSELIDALLSLSRVVRTEMNIVSVDLSQIANEVVEELNQAEPNRIVLFTVKDEMHVNGDPRLLRIALRNLIENAWKFTSKTSEAKIEISQSGSMNHRRLFYVRDNGAGFNNAYAEKLFAPFQRLHTSQEFPGTGVGLAIVQRIIQRHGGEVWAEGVEGEGATFYFTL